jgi:hypothetical protein
LAWKFYPENVQDRPPLSGALEAALALQAFFVPVADTSSRVLQGMSLLAIAISILAAAISLAAVLAS